MTCMTSWVQLTEGSFAPDFTAMDIDECYVFTMIDTYGDGLNASQWGQYADGSASVVSMDGETEVVIILDYNGALEFFELAAGIEITSGTVPHAPVV